MGWTLVGDGRLEQKGASPAMTACVVGDACRFGPSGRPGSALPIRARSTRPRIVAHRERRRRGGRCQGDVRGGEGLHDEGPQRLLEGGDRTGGVGEGGLEMGEDLGRRSVFRGQFGRRAAPEEGGADVALAMAEASPDAQQGPVAQRAVDGADGSADAVGDGALEEAPQTAGGQAEPSDLVGEPDAEGPPATATCLAVAAKDPPRADRFSLRAALVKSAEKAVSNQRADNLAVRTGRLLEPFGDRVPFLRAAVKPSLLAHGVHASAKIVILAAWGRGGVVAGYD